MVQNRVRRLSVCQQVSGKSGPRFGQVNMSTKSEGLATEKRKISHLGYI